MIMILDVDVTAEGGIIKFIARKGDTTTLSAAGAVAPLSEANTTRRRQAATTLGA